jgi:hypothetical protein
MQRFITFQCQDQKIFIMKQILLAILFGGFIISIESCKKVNTKQNIDIASSIIGSWELRQSSAAMNPTPKNYTVGNGNILKFTIDNYETYVNGTLVKKGLYAITMDTTVEANVCLVFSKDQFANRIIFDSAYNMPKIFIQISGDKLTFISGCYAYDAGDSEEYEKE